MKFSAYIIAVNYFLPLPLFVIINVFDVYFGGSRPGVQHTFILQNSSLIVRRRYDTAIGCSLFCDSSQSIGFG